MFKTFLAAIVATTATARWRGGSSGELDMSDVQEIVRIMCESGDTVLADWCADNKAKWDK